jgi:ferredoxin
MVYIIKFEREKCLGCGACTICDNWEMQDDGKVKPLQIKLEEIGCNQEAVDTCPLKLIKIEKE